MLQNRIARSLRNLSEVFHYVGGVEQGGGFPATRSTPKPQFALEISNILAFPVVVGGKRVGNGLDELERVRRYVAATSTCNPGVDPALRGLPVTEVVLKNKSETFRSQPKPGIRIRRRKNCSVHELDDFGE